MLTCRISFLLVCVQSGSFKCEILTLLKLITIPFTRIRISPFEQQTPVAGTKPLCTFTLEFKTTFTKYQRNINHKDMWSSTLVCGSTVRPRRYSSAVRRCCNQTLQAVFSNAAGILRLQELNLQVPLDTQVLFFWWNTIIFIIQVPSFGTGCKIFPVKKTQNIKTITVLRVTFLALKEPLP